jgi:O-antigen/teichoic acid export membrane protein
MQVFRQWPIYFIGRILPAGIGFCAVALYTRLLSPQSFGIYALLLSTSYFVGLIGFTWLRVASLRMIATVAPSDESKLKATIGLGFAGMSVVVSAVIIFIVRVYQPAWGWTPALLTAACAVSSGWFELNVAVMQARLRVLAYSILQMGRAVVALLGSLALIAAGLKANALLGGFVLGNCAGFGALGFWRNAVVSGRFDRNLLHQIFHFGWPVSATAVGNMSVTFLRYLLNAISGSAAVGLFAAASDFSQQSIGLLIGTATIAGQPLAFRARDLGDHEALAEQLRNNARLIFAVGFPAAVGLIALSGPFSVIYLGPRFHVHTGLVMAISAAVMFLSGLRTSYFEQAFEITRHTTPVAVNTGVRLVLVVAPSFWLIGTYGAVGAAIAVLISETLGLGLSVVWANRMLDLPIPWASWLKVAAATSAMVAAVLLIPGKSTVLGLAAAIVVGIAVYGAAVALTHIRGLRMYVSTFSPALHRLTRS